MPLFLLKKYSTLLYTKDIRSDQTTVFATILSHLYIVAVLLETYGFVNSFAFDVLYRAALAFKLNFSVPNLATLHFFLTTPKMVYKGMQLLNFLMLIT